MHKLSAIGCSRISGMVLLLATFLVFSVTCGKSGTSSEDIVAAMELNRRGLEALRFKDYRRARGLFEQAHRLDRGRADYVNNVGVVSLEQKQYGAAIGSFQRAIKTNRFYARGYFNLGVCYQKIKKDRAAVGAYKKALALTPSSFLIHYNLGIVYSRMGDKKSARRSFSVFLKRAPRQLTGPRRDARNRLEKIKPKK